MTENEQEVDVIVCLLVGVVIALTIYAALKLGGVL